MSSTKVLLHKNKPVLWESPKSAKDILERARELIKKGWVQTFFEMDNCFCMSGAINKAGCGNSAGYNYLQDPSSMINKKSLNKANKNA